MFFAFILKLSSSIYLFLLFKEPNFIRIIISLFWFFFRHFWLVCEIFHMLLYYFNYQKITWQCIGFIKKFSKLGKYFHFKILLLDIHFSIISFSFSGMRVLTIQNLYSQKYLPTFHTKYLKGSFQLPNSGI